LHNLLPDIEDADCTSASKPLLRAEYSKTSYESGSKALEKLFGVKSLDKAIEVQSEYAKSMFEDFTARTTKIGQLYADLGKEVFKPFAANMSKAAAAK
jgi:hypothetical protein